MHRDSIRIIVLRSDVQLHSEIMCVRRLVIIFKHGRFLKNHLHAIIKIRCPECISSTFGWTKSYSVQILLLPSHIFSHLSWAVKCSIFDAPQPFYSQLIHLFIDLSLPLLIPHPTWWSSERRCILEFLRI